jgi:hypothetical protein
MTGVALSLAKHTRRTIHTLNHISGTDMCAGNRRFW